MRTARQSVRVLRAVRFVRIVGVGTLLLGSSYAGGCSDASLLEVGPCRGASCSCEQDPQQPLCKGYNERGDARLEEPFDASLQDAREAGEAGEDESGDGEARDSGDASDG